MADAGRGVGREELCIPTNTRRREKARERDDDNFYFKIYIWWHRYLCKSSVGLSWFVVFGREVGGKLGSLTPYDARLGDPSAAGAIDPSTGLRDEADDDTFLYDDEDDD